MAGGLDRRLPSGDVTFLFTDIEGSTRLFQRLGERYPVALRRHHSIIRAAIAAHGGHEMETEGDAFFIVFAEASSAVTACLAAQRAIYEENWPSGGAIRVRMGLHTSEAQPVDGEYIALAVHQAARVASAAHGGQVIASNATAERAREHLPARATLTDLGAHLLKDFDEPCGLFQLYHPDLPSAFPPLRVASARRDNLPSFRTSLIGRGDERVAVATLLQRERVVIVTGPGGVGKTRFAIEVANDILDRYPGGTWFVDLLGVTEGTDVPAAIAHALGGRGAEGADDLDGVCRWLADKSACLVLDNCEHVVDSSAAAVATIINRCPGATVLATSRLPLGVYGEQLFRLVPLASPAADRDLDLAALERNESVRLFIDRVRLVRPGLDVAAYGPDIATICRRLDGVPLAIELAAARARAFDPPEIAKRLDDRFALLAERVRGGDSRKQGLREVIDWSYDLLTPTERSCFRRLGVFADGFSLDAARDVAATDGISHDAVADAVTALVDHSLVEFGGSDHAPYRMLDSIRAYAVAQMYEAGEAETAAVRLRDFYLDLAERAAPALTGPEGVRWYERLAREQNNVAAALALSADRGDVDELTRLVIAMTEFWPVFGRYRECLRWCEVVIDLDGVPPYARARAMLVATRMARILGDRARSEAMADETLAAAEALDDADLIARTKDALSSLKLGADDLDGAERLAVEAIALAEEAGSWMTASSAKESLALVFERRGLYDRQVAVLEEVCETYAAYDARRRLARAVGNLGIAHLLQEHVPEGEALLEQALDLRREVGDIHEVANILANLGYMAFTRGDLDDAVRLTTDALEIAREIGHALTTAFVLNNLAESLAAAGERGRAREVYLECLDIAARIKDTERMCFCFDGLAALALAEGDAATAVRLIAAADALRARKGVTLQRPYQLANEAALVDARDQLGSVAFDDAWRSGAAHEVDELVASLAPITARRGN